MMFINHRTFFHSFSFFILFLFSFFCCVSCSHTSTDGESQSTQAEFGAEAVYYNPSFVDKLKAIKELSSAGKVDEALLKLKGWSDSELNSSEKALKYNFFGVLTLQKGNIEVAISSFQRAIDEKSEDPSLIGQIYLNLAAVYFKSNKLKESEDALGNVSVSELKESEQFKYYHLSYLLKPQNPPSSFLYLVKYLGKWQTMDELKADSLFPQMVEEFNRDYNDDEKMRFLYSLDTTPTLAEVYLSIYAAEKRYHDGDLVMAQELITWMKKRFSALPVANELIIRTEDKFVSFSKMDKNVLGVILPLTGDKARFGQRVMSGIDAATKLLQKEGIISSVYVRNSEGNEVLGGHHVQELAKQQNVAVIIGGLFPEEAKEEYLKAKKSGTFFISLSQIYLPKEEKDFLLLEIPGSIESVVHQFFAPNFIAKFGKRGAIMCTDDERGKAFMHEFVEYAEKSKIIDVNAVELLPKNTIDFRDPVMKLLGVAYERERQEELDMMQRIYALDRKAKNQSTHTLNSVVDFDWLFLPVFPDGANQLIPLFSYYDAYKMTFIGDSSWRSRSLETMSRRKPLYFVGENYGESLETFKNFYKEMYHSWPQLMETSAFDAMKVTRSLFAENGDTTSRADFHEALQKKAKLEGATSYWTLQDGLWIKSLNVLKLGAGKVETAL